MSPDNSPQDRFGGAFALGGTKKKKKKSSTPTKEKSTEKNMDEQPPKIAQAQVVNIQLDQVVPHLAKISTVLETISNQPMQVVIVGDKRAGQDLPEDALKGAYKEYKRRKKLREYIEMKKVIEDEDLET